MPHPDDPPNRSQPHAAMVLLPLRCLETDADRDLLLVVRRAHRPCGSPRLGSPRPRTERVDRPQDEWTLRLVGHPVMIGNRDPRHRPTPVMLANLSRSTAHVRSTVRCSDPKAIAIRIRQVNLSRPRLIEDRHAELRGNRVDIGDAEVHERVRSSVSAMLRQKDPCRPIPCKRHKSRKRRLEPMNPLLLIPEPLVPLGSASGVRDTKNGNDFIGHTSRVCPTGSRLARREQHRGERLGPVFVTGPNLAAPSCRSYLWQIAQAVASTLVAPLIDVRSTAHV